MIISLTTGAVVKSIFRELVPSIKKTGMKVKFDSLKG